MVVQIMHGNYLRDVLLNPQLWPAEKSYSKEGTRCWATSFCFIMQIANDRYFYCSWMYSCTVLCCVRGMIHVSIRTGDQQSTAHPDPLFFPLFQAVSPLKCRDWSASVQRGTEVPSYGCQQRLVPCIANKRQPSTGCVVEHHFLDENYDYEY